ncbi:MAG: NfeD family protein [Geobacteraceae bacterium]|nr:NfeD family protein [Geobacteraceae bacterium]
MHFEWWYWIIAGICLFGLELIVPSFTIIWFGLGALVVGVLSGLWPGIPPAGQISLWFFASVSFTLLWFKYLKPKGERTHAGMLKGGIVGESGVIIRGTEDSYGRGIVKFRIAVLGTDEWSCYSSEILHVGDRVRVVDIEGQILKVEII